MKECISSDLYAWSKDLEATSSVLRREVPAFAMLLGWLDKFVCGKGLQPGREACALFWKEAVMAKDREGWPVAAALCRGKLVLQIP